MKSTKRQKHAACERRAPHESSMRSFDSENSGFVLVHEAFGGRAGTVSGGGEDLAQRGRAGDVDVLDALRDGVDRRLAAAHVEAVAS